MSTLDVIKELVSFYLSNGSRGISSSHKVGPLHKHVGDLVRSSLPDHRVICYPEKELKVKTSFKPKNVDVGILDREGNFVAWIAIKIIMSSLSKNQNNRQEEAHSEYVKIKEVYPNAKHINLMWNFDFTPRYSKQKVIGFDVAKSIETKEIGITRTLHIKGGKFLGHPCQITETEIKTCIDAISIDENELKSHITDFCRTIIDNVNVEHDPIAHTMNSFSKLSLDDKKKFMKLLPAIISKDI